MGTKWLFENKISSKDKFHDWLMNRVGFATYLKNKLWDSASLLHYIIVIRGDNLYIEFHTLKSNVIEIDFSKGNTDDTTEET